MRAIVVEEDAGPEDVRLQDLPERGRSSDGQRQRILVEVHAASVSFPDLLQTRGLYQHGLDSPFVSGGEFAGVVVEPMEARFPGTTQRVTTRSSAWGEGTLRPRIGARLPLEQGGEALRILDCREATGNVAVDVRSTS